MFIEDQEEDVEEEEEFHEVEEEKHKTSQESVGGSTKVTSPKSSAKTSASSSSKPSPSSSKAPPSNESSEKEIAPPPETPSPVEVSSITPPEIIEAKSEVSQASAETTPQNLKHEPIKTTQEVDETDSVKKDSASEEKCEPETAVGGLGGDEKAPTVEPPSVEPTLAEPSTVEAPQPEAAPAEVPADDVTTENKSQGVKNTDWTDIMLSSGIQDSNEQSEISPVEEEDKPDSKEAQNEKGEEGEEKNPDEADKKELDLDEDVKNPQYIPKKGVFYEHDDRSHDANSKKQPSTSVKKDEEVVEVKESASNKKASTQEKPNDNRKGGRRQRTENDRWNHDLFRDEKQKPKSKSELINVYGYDIRHERASRNQNGNRAPRGTTNQTNNNNNNNSDRQNSSQENQRQQRSRDNRAPRQNQPGNRSRERRPRRINNRNRSDTSGTPSRRDVPNSGRPVKQDSKDVKNEVGSDGRQGFQAPYNQSLSTAPAPKRDYQQPDANRDRSVRNDNRGRRQNSKDRPVTNSSVEESKLPPINTVMPPITTWSNKIEDMVKEEASRKHSPSRHQNPQSMNSGAKGRSNDYWPQNQTNKTMYQDRPVRNLDENRQPQQQQQHYNQRRYTQDRDDAPKQTQYVNRNQYNDRSNNHHQEWRRTNQYNTYAKSNEYEPIKTQTFENSRLSQATNMNRSNFRDAREIINERRMQNQQNFQLKIQPGMSGPEHSLHHRHQQHPQQHQPQQHSPQAQHHHQQHQHQHQLVHQQQMLQHQHMIPQHQAPQHVRQQQQQQQPPSQQPQAQLPQQQTQNPNHQQSQPPSQAPQPAPPQPQQQQPPMQGQRQQQAPQPQQHPPQAHSAQSRQTLAANNVADGVQDPGRLSATNNQTSSDLINSRPIIKSDAYTGSAAGPLSQPIQQHSQNHHRSLGGGPMAQQAPPNSAASHLLPSHLGASGTQAQYYSPAGGSRDSTGLAALASAYHGYMTGGHSVMDATRYHMTSQQLTDHGYMAPPGQANDVAAASVLHQQGMYPDAAATGGTVASSTYLAQAGSTLSPSSNIPVTGAGPPPLPPVSYLQHSQYPPPYSNPYSQPQHNQAPPQSSHAYPYWTYI